MKQESNRFAFWAGAFCCISLFLTAVLWWEQTSRHILVRTLEQTSRRQQVMAQALVMERQSGAQLRKLLEGKGQEVDLLAQKLTAQSAAALQLQQVVSRQNEQISQLQTKLLISQQKLAANDNSSPALAPAISLSKVTVPLGPQSKTARILQVNPEWNFVVVNAGWEQLGIGDVLDVYRDKDLVARVEVERVQQELAAARVLPAYQTAAIQVNDQAVIQ